MRMKIPQNFLSLRYILYLLQDTRLFVAVDLYNVVPVNVPVLFTVFIKHWFLIKIGNQVASFMMNFSL